MCDPVGVLEIAERCGVSAGTVSAWRYRLKMRVENFPDEDYTVGGRAAWEWATIEGWLIRTGRAPNPGGTVVINTIGGPCVHLGCDAIGMPDTTGGLVWAQTRATPADHDHKAASAEG